MADNDGLEIVVGDNYRESFPDIMGVLPGEAIDVIRNPDAHESVAVSDDSSLHINISVRLPSESKPYYLLALDRVAEGGVRVLHDVFKFFGDLCPDASTKTPLELLSAVADRFAYKVQPGGDAKKLILQESFPCAPEDVNPDTIIRLMMPINITKGEEVLGTQYVTYNEGEQTLEFAVAFVWNVTRFRAYLARAN